MNESLLTYKAAAATSTVNVTVLSLTPANAGRLFALASIEIEVDGVMIALHGIREMRVGTESTRIELPQYRDAAGLQRPVVTLPPEVYGPIGTPCSIPWSSGAWRAAEPAARVR